MSITELFWITVTAGNVMRSAEHSIHVQWSFGLMRDGTSGVTGSQSCILGTSGLSFKKDEACVISLEQTLTTRKDGEHKRGAKINWKKISICHTCGDRLQFHFWSFPIPTEHTPHYDRAIASLHNTLRTRSVHRFTISSTHELDHLPTKNLEKKRLKEKKKNLIRTIQLVKKSQQSDYLRS